MNSCRVIYKLEYCSGVLVKRGTLKREMENGKYKCQKGGYYIWQFVQILQGSRKLYAYTCLYHTSFPK